MGIAGLPTQLSPAGMLPRTPACAPIFAPGPTFEWSAIPTWPAISTRRPSGPRAAQEREVKVGDLGPLRDARADVERRGGAEIAHPARHGLRASSQALQGATAVQQDGVDP